MYELIFTEGGLSGLLTPQDSPNAAILAARYKFLRRIAPAWVEFHHAIQGAEEEADDGTK
jgi:hypothetical protein